MIKHNRCISDHLRQIDWFTTIAAREKAEAGMKFRFHRLLFHPIGKVLGMYFVRLGFLDGLAVRRGLHINHFVNEEWQTGNGLSVLKARAELREPFVLLMADHLVDERLLVALQAEPLEEGTVRLAVDRNTHNPLVDLTDATKVSVRGDFLQRI